MTNKEKREYLSLLLENASAPFIGERERFELLLRKMPRSLFKYRRYDQYAFEMLEKGVARLSPAKDLDDPFDCMIDLDPSPLISEKTEEPKADLIRYLLKTIAPQSETRLQDKGFQKDLVRALKKGAAGVVQLCEEKDLFHGLDGAAKDNVLSLVESIQSLLDSHLQSFLPNELSPYLDSKNKTGVCSLSETRDNKVMWSLYGDLYKGYCVEYEIPTDENFWNLCPVVYQRYGNNNLLLAFADTNCQIVARNVSDGRVPTNIGSMMSLLCTKDSDWSYQKEWRIIRKDPGAFCKLKTKAVYIGFGAEPANIEQTAELGKRKGFSVFLMERPSGKRHIKYKRIT